MVNPMAEQPRRKASSTELVIADSGSFSSCNTSWLLILRMSGISPADSRAARPQVFLTPKDVDAHRVAQARALHEIARERGQSLAQMALAWVLRQPAVTSALIGASRVEQVEQCAAAVSKLEFSGDELAAIERVLAS